MLRTVQRGWDKPDGSPDQPLRIQTEPGSDLVYGIKLSGKGFKPPISNVELDGSTPPEISILPFTDDTIVWRATGYTGSIKLRVTFGPDEEVWIKEVEHYIQ